MHGIWCTNILLLDLLKCYNGLFYQCTLAHISPWMCENIFLFKKRETNILFLVRNCYCSTSFLFSVQLHTCTYVYENTVVLWILHSKLLIWSYLDTGASFFCISLLSIRISYIIILYTSTRSLIPNKLGVLSAFALLTCFTRPQYSCKWELMQAIKSIYVTLLLICPQSVLPSLCFCSLLDLILLYKHAKNMVNTFQMLLVILVAKFVKQSLDTWRIGKWEAIFPSLVAWSFRILSEL